MKKVINRLEFGVASCAICVAVFATALNVILRYCFGRPIYQAEEIATSMFVWLVFVGAAACYGEKAHIGIDCLVNLLPKKAKRVVALLTSAAMVLITALMTCMSVLFTINAGAKLTAALRLPYAWIDSAAVLGFAFMFLHAIEFFIENIKNFRSGEAEKEGAV